MPASRSLLRASVRRMLRAKERARPRAAQRSPSSKQRTLAPMPRRRAKGIKLGLRRRRRSQKLQRKGRQTSRTSPADRPPVRRRTRTALRPSSRHGSSHWAMYGKSYTQYLFFYKGGFEWGQLRHLREKTTPGFQAKGQAVTRWFTKVPHHVWCVSLPGLPGGMVEVCVQQGGSLRAHHRRGDCQSCRGVAGGV